MKLWILWGQTVKMNRKYNFVFDKFDSLSKKSKYQTWILIEFGELELFYYYQRLFISFYWNFTFLFEARLTQFISHWSVFLIIINVYTSTFQERSFFSSYCSHLFPPLVHSSISITLKSLIPRLLLHSLHSFPRAVDVLICIILT